MNKPIYAMNPTELRERASELEELRAEAVANGDEKTAAVWERMAGLYLMQAKRIGRSETACPSETTARQTR